jgi:hypothetical protein
MDWRKSDLSAYCTYYLHEYTTRLTAQHARSPFYVVHGTSAKFRLHARNMAFNAQNISLRIIIIMSKRTSIFFIHFIFCSAIAQLGPRPPHCWGFHNTQLDTYNGQESSERVISSSQRPLPTQQPTQEMNIHALGGIRTRNPSNQKGGRPKP